MKRLGKLRGVVDDSAWAKSVVAELSESKRWALKQALSAGRFYGDGGTIHHTGHLDVEVTEDGRVVSVWFRCQLLPFTVTAVVPERAAHMDAAQTGLPALCGVDLVEAV